MTGLKQLYSYRIETIDVLEDGHIIHDAAVCEMTSHLDQIVNRIQEIPINAISRKINIEIFNLCETKIEGVKNDLQ